MATYNGLDKPTAAEVFVEKTEAFSTGAEYQNPNTAGLYDLRDDKGVATVEEVASENEEGVDNFVKDPFVPFDDLPEENRNYLTIRAIVVGCCFGAVVNASNIYLGLKTGWTFTANIFGAIGGFAVLKIFEKSFGNIPILGGKFGPKENGILTTAAMASGGMSGVFVSAWPALYQLGLLDTPDADYWRMVTLTLVGGYFGFFFATPLRKFFIIYVARELRLVFPSYSASAVSIRSMHQAGGGEAMAKLKMRALSIAFAAAVILRVVSQYALGILWDWHIFTWFYIWGNYNNLAINVENWGWFIEWTPAFIGIGMLVGLNVALSFFAGSVLAWGIVGPALIATGHGHGTRYYTGKWADVVTFYGLSDDDTRADSYSPRFWLLWPGVLCMLVVSFVELGCQWRIFALGGKALYRFTRDGVMRVFRKRSAEGKETEEEDLDPAAPEDRVKMWMWLPPLIVVIILMCVVTSQQFGMPVGESILAIILAFIFSLLAIQCTGATDITPLTAASKASQLVLGGTTSGLGWNVHRAQRLNLLGGALASIGANQSSDLTGDFRVGFLLGVKPKIQWVAQGVGTIVAVFLAPAMYRLFSKAYPCINAHDPSPSCPFSAPSVAAWRAVAVAVTAKEFPVPKSSGIFAICFSIFGAGMVLIRNFVLVGNRAYIRRYWPNVMVMALAFVLNATVYGTANVMGALAAHIWAKKNAKSFEIYGFAIAAGLIAGEGIGGVINAIFQVAGIAGPADFGTNIACPADSC